MAESKEVKKLLAELAKCKSSTSPEARAIRKQLREEQSYFVSKKGPALPEKAEKKSEVKKAPVKSAKKAEKVVDPDDDDEDLDE